MKTDGLLARWGITLAGGLIVLAVWAAYGNSWSTPFVFDDPKAIALNPTIRHLWPLTDVLAAPSYVGSAAGRPLVNLSLAVNYALGGLHVEGYHLFNTFIHVLAGLVLFGVVRRTLRQPLLRERYGSAALPLGFMVALLWVLHPLQTESVTFIVQRTESMMGLFYLLTLYGFIRSVAAPAPRRWLVFTVLVCSLGMATKEVMVSAPVLVLLYDRTFVAGSFRGAWQQRGRLHAALAATWLLLAWLVVGSNLRDGVARLGSEMSSWDYALTQCQAIILYLRLSLWPSPLVVDYGMAVVRSLAVVWWQALILLLLVAGTFVALWRRPVIGFLGFWFFAILAPSSSIVPLVMQTMAEHRMYLPLAALIVLAVFGAYRWLGDRSWAVLLVLALVAGGLTVRRNQEYASNVGLWTVTVAAQPQNPRAQSSLGCALAIAGQPEAAESHLAEAVRLDPNYPEARFNLGNFLFRQYRPAEALEQCAAAIRVRPNYYEARFLLAGVLVRLGRPTEALEQFAETLRIKPNYVEARQTLAETLATMGRTSEALDQYQQALNFQRNNPALHLGLGYILGQMQRWEEAVPHFAAAVALQPDSAEAESALGGALGRLGRTDEAVGHFAAATRLDPESVAAHFNLGNALFALHRWAEAAEHYAAVVRLRPEFAEAHNNLGNTLTQLGRYDEAQAQYEETLRLKPDYTPASNNLIRLEKLRSRQP